MSVDLFDVNIYRLANPDLIQQGLTTDEQLRNQFNQAGANQGRFFSLFADLSVYQSFNPDLTAAGLTTNKQLYDHLEKVGVAEGRRFGDFDLGFYLQKNNDVSIAFQGSHEKAMQHLQTIGLKEGRQFSPTIDIKYYLEANPDVNKAVGGDPVQGLIHLEFYGLGEGRKFSPFVDLNLYLALNPDLKDIPVAFSLRNLANKGLGEGRRFSQSFDTTYYGNNNPDLLTAYAASRGLRTDAVLANQTEKESYNTFLVWHFETKGIDEGRRSSAEFDVNYYRRQNPDLANLTNKQLYEHFRSFGLNEARQFSDRYDASYYRTVSSAPDRQNLSLEKLYEYYLTTGSKKELAVRQLPATGTPTNINIGNSGITSITDALTGTSAPNPTRQGSYSRDYLLNGITVGQQVQIDMTANYDTYLQLVDAVTGQVIAQNDNIGATNLSSRLNFTVSSGLNYIVRASSIDANAIGAYTVTTSVRSSGGTIAPSLLANSIFATDSNSNSLLAPSMALTNGQVEIA